MARGLADTTDVPTPQQVQASRRMGQAYYKETGQTPNGMVSDPYRDALQRFFQMMMGPLNMNDPQVRQLMSMVQNATGQAAVDRGVQGPLSVLGTQQGLAGALTQLQQQRYGLGMQAYNAYQQDKNFDLTAAQFQNQQQMEALQRQAAQGAGVGQSIGSVAGGLLGGAGGFMVGGPAGMVAGAGAGAQLGGGIGGQIGGGMSGYGRPATVYTGYGSPGGYRVTPYRAGGNV